MSDRPALVAVRFADLAGWDDAAAVAAFTAFRRHAAAPVPARGGFGIDGATLQRLAHAAAGLGGTPEETTARVFFETHFTPHRIAGGDAPFLTGYFEPDLAASAVATPRFRVPLLAAPAGLVAVDAAIRPADFDPDLVFARRTAAGLEALPDRAAIEDGALAGEDLAIAWVEDPVDAFFAHVQGSVRLHLGDGRVLRLAHAGRNGHPYTSIGRRLIDRRAVAVEAMTADVLRDWLKAHPAAARDLMRENRSFVFFRVQPDLDPGLGAVTAAGVALTPQVSLAVDLTWHTWGTPIFVAADLPLAVGGETIAFHRLMIAQDTGSAIRGPARGDVFVGLGAAAGVAAGRLRHRASTFVVLIPKETRP